MIWRCALVLRSALSLRYPPPPTVLFPVRLSATPRAVRCVAVSRCPRIVLGLWQGGEEILSRLRTLQHEPSDKNKRSSNATGRREADTATAQMRCRERAARNSHEGEEDRKPDILSPNFSLGILHFIPLLPNFRSLYRSQKYSLYFYLKSFNKL